MQVKYQDAWEVGQSIHFENKEKKQYLIKQINNNADSQVNVHVRLERL